VERSPLHTRACGAAITAANTRCKGPPCFLRSKISTEFILSHRYLFPIRGSLLRQFHSLIKLISEKKILVLIIKSIDDTSYVFQIYFIFHFCMSVLFSLSNDFRCPIKTARKPDNTSAFLMF
jgi:hypothetical protein